MATIDPNADLSESMGVVVIEVGYDGPDLARVARMTGLSEESVVIAHTRSLWTVEHCGFAPGFAYLTGGDPRLAVPRLDTPRPEVSSGSVALAGDYTGVYPRASPGGWNLIGRTGAVMWDLERDPPALLAVGESVQFRAVRARAILSGNAGAAEVGNQRVGMAEADPPVAAEANAAGVSVAARIGARTASAAPGAGPRAAAEPNPPVSAAATRSRAGVRGPTVTVVKPGILCLVQDLGRFGYESMGVGPSGAADRSAANLANELVGNAPEAAVLEVLFGGAVLRAHADITVAVTGAAVPLSIDRADYKAQQSAAPESALRRTGAGMRPPVAAAPDPSGPGANGPGPNGPGPNGPHPNRPRADGPHPNRPRADGPDQQARALEPRGATQSELSRAAVMGQAMALPDGATLRLGRPKSGVRTYISVRGGIDAPVVLGSRSTDTLSGIGPPPVRAGDHLPVGTAIAEHPIAAVGWDVIPEGSTRDATGAHDAGDGETTSGATTLVITPGPQRDLIDDDQWRLLVGSTWTASSQSDRVGIRLTGATVTIPADVAGRMRYQTLGRGSVQVPPSGQPIVFLADHPVTGGYPVIAQLSPGAVDRAAQLRPGAMARFATTDTVDSGR